MKSMKALKAENKYIHYKLSFVQNCKFELLISTDVWYQEFNFCLKKQTHRFKIKGFFRIFWVTPMTTRKSLGAQTKTEGSVAQRLGLPQADDSGSTAGQIFQFQINPNI